MLDERLGARNSRALPRICSNGEVAPSGKDSWNGASTSHDEEPSEPSALKMVTPPGVELAAKTPAAPSFTGSGSSHPAGSSRAGRRRECRGTFRGRRYGRLGAVSGRTSAPRLLLFRAAPRRPPSLRPTAVGSTCMASRGPTSLAATASALAPPSGGSSVPADSFAASATLAPASLFPFAVELANARAGSEIGPAA